MDENTIGERLLGCALKIHKALGPGMLESAYEACLAHELGKAGLDVKRQLALPLVYDGVIVEPAYRLDLLINDLVVVEVKAVERVADVHRAQVLSYLKIGGYRLGYVLNFNTAMMKEGIHRIAYGL